MLCIPCINPLLQNLSKKRFSALLVFFFIFEYLICAYSNSAYANLVRGFFFYLAGAFLRLFILSEERKTSALKSCLFFLLALVFMCSEAIGYYALNAMEFAARLRTLFAFCLVKTSVLGAAVALFFGCAYLPIGNVRMVNTVAAYMFGVYLLHENVLARPVIWDIFFDVLHRQLPSENYACYAVLTILCVFVACVVMDAVLQRILLNPLLRKIRWI